MLYKHALLAGVVCAVLALAPFAASAADSPPHVDTGGGNMQPAYPASAIPNKESGAVVLDAKVRADGKVSAVTVAKPSGFSDLDSAAANAVNGWKFIPAMHDGQPVDGTATVQIVFTPPS